MLADHLQVFQYSIEGQSYILIFDAFVQCQKQLIDNLPQSLLWLTCYIIPVCPSSLKAMITPY